MHKFNGSIKTFMLFGVLSVASQSFAGQSYSASDESAADGLAGSLELPSDWELAPVKGSSCSTNTRSNRGNTENSYAETSSKFLTWLTGTTELAEYEPIGEVANYFGFAALRNEIRDRSGSQGDERFRGSIYREILELLDDSQRAVLYDLVEEHEVLLKDFLADRVSLVNELWGLKEGKEIDFDRVTELAISLGESEGAITVTAAKAYAKLTPMLTDEQMQYLWDIRSGKIGADDMRSSTLAYADQANAQYAALDSFGQEVMQEVASKVIAWATGDLEDSIYLPPGKIGNYFGFANYRYVDRAAVSRGGSAALVHDLLNDEQRDLMCDLSWVVADFTEEYIYGRAELIARLHQLKSDPAAPINDSALATNYAMGAGLGEGRRATIEAMTFNLIASMLSEEQVADFNRLRVQSTTGKSLTSFEEGESGGGKGGKGGDRDKADRDRDDRDRGDRERVDGERRDRNAED